MTTFNIPTLQTDRFTLRAPCLSDFEAYAAFGSSERSAPVGGPFDRTTAFRNLCALGGQWQLRGYGRWIVAGKETDAPLGIVGIYHPDDWPEPEIGWTLFEEAEGRSVAFEAAQATRAFAYETLGWTTLVSHVAPDNTRSAALARRMGAEKEGVFQHPSYGQFDIWRHLSPDEVAA
ncbi:ribosomal-protein-alanine N-acetyltransferase [Aliiruegeria haliotis]|uniref:Ribosomal-protein-alanine N-acetyltransferase n=1 Tax=Aliiruegeria haliotis TaxID=1280846 RepID=A0A2T0RR65_9RHOB|nr:GNAT family N-acetyltransferase [Aliiruegeria haliotis]PRY23695.1 ribosomal-protein-alanine N-acetyltransferase [Aliiruegeria haliotis]